MISIVAYMLTNLNVCVFEGATLSNIAAQLASWQD